MGKPEWVRELLAGDFELEFEEVTSFYREADRMRA
jgi:hypothetical protein